MIFTPVTISSSPTTLVRPTVHHSSSVTLTTDGGTSLDRVLSTLPTYAGRTPYLIVTTSPNGDTIAVSPEPRWAKGGAVTHCTPFEAEYDGDNATFAIELCPATADALYGCRGGYGLTLEVDAAGTTVTPHRA